MRAPRFWVLAPLVAAIAACAGGPLGLSPAGGPAVVAPARVPALTGRAVFADRALMATPAEVAKGAAITLIAPDLTPVASAVTGTGGSFTLAFPDDFTPTAGQTYVLQATKGVGGNQPGHAVVRLRTLVRFAGGAWQGLVAGTGQVIDAGTTAIAQLAERRRADDDWGLAVIGTYDPKTAVFTPQIGYDLGEQRTFAALIKQALLGGEDPIRTLDYGSVVRRGAAEPLLYATSPAFLPVGGILTFEGEDLDPAAGGTAVDFGTGKPVLATFDGDTWKVHVPDGATGTIRVLTPGAASAPMVLPVSEPLLLDLTTAAARDAALTTAIWPLASVTGATLAPDPGSDPATYPTATAADLVSTAIDRGLTAGRIGQALGRIDTGVGAKIAVSFQASADGTTWGPTWHPADGETAFPAQTGRYVRLRIGLTAEIAPVAPTLARVAFHAVAP